MVDEHQIGYVYNSPQEFAEIINRIDLGDIMLREGLERNIRGCLDTEFSHSRNIKGLIAFVERILINNES